MGNGNYYDGDGASGSSGLSLEDLCDEAAEETEGMFSGDDFYNMFVSKVNPLQIPHDIYVMSVIKQPKLKDSEGGRGN